MKNVTEAFEKTALEFPNSRKSIMFIKNKLRKKAAEAMVDIENIKSNGSRNHSEFIYYSKCTTFFDRHHREILNFYREYTDEVLKTIGELEELKSCNIDSIVSVLYGKDKSVLNYQYISSIIWQDYVNKVISTVLFNLKQK